VISRNLQWAGHVARNSYRTLAVKLLRKHTLGRLRKRWSDNIEMDLREIDCEDGCFRVTSNIALWY
jgi:hypothetical protein